MLEPLNIALCEDTKSEAEKILEILKTCTIPNQCTFFQSGEELLKIYEPQKFDLLLMDIFMDGISGIDTVEKIREIDEYIPVAFITTSTDFTLESYRLSALRYIVKPFKQKDIEGILYLAKIEKDNIPCLIIHKNGNEEKIRFSNIIYIEAQSHNLMIHLKSGEIIKIYKKLSDIIPQLNEDMFFIPHKSFAVNIDEVQCINDELRCFLMSNDKNVPIRREVMSKAKKAFENKLFYNTRRSINGY